jgi:ABC-type antimicrobial peptide transport system permease subunit
VTPRGYDQLFGSYFEGHGAVYAFRDGVDPAAGTARVREVVGAIPGAASTGVFPAPAPQRIGEIRNVQVLPVLLGVFLALLAIGAVGHALATAVRRRRHDVAVLRAVGMTKWQCRGVVFTQATVLAAVGLAFGMPLGIALGRTIWRLVADSTPLVYQPPAVALALLLVVLAALVLANLLAAWPSRRAVRLPVNQILRAE